MDFDQIKDKILDSIDQVYGEIYIIKNIVNNKCYIGQVRSHRLNHTKYRPFGTIGRFKDHLSEALCNTKKHQCSYLNAAIRKYGKENFLVETLERCELKELDELECKKIAEYDTIFPNGYNLTIGGKMFGKFGYISNNTINDVKKKHRKYQTEDTKQKISARNKEYRAQPGISEIQSKKTYEQHMKTKLEKFKNIVIDINLIDKYIRPLNSKTYIGYSVIVEDKRADFLLNKNKYSPLALDNTREKAVNFIKNIVLYNGKKQSGLGNPQPSSPPSHTAEEGEGSETKRGSVSNDGLASLRKLKI